MGSEMIKGVVFDFRVVADPNCLSRVLAVLTAFRGEGRYAAVVGSVPSSQVYAYVAQHVRDRDQRRLVDWESGKERGGTAEQVAGFMSEFNMVPRMVLYVGRREREAALAGVPWTLAEGEAGWARISKRLA